MTFVEAIKAVYESKKVVLQNERATSFQIKKGLENNLTNKKNNDYEKVFDFNDVLIVTYIYDFL